MAALKGFQRKYLRGQAHHLDPVVMIGKNGLAEPVLEKINASLEHHELIKIRFTDYHRDAIQAMCSEIAEMTYAELCGTIGHVAIFYRPHPEAEKRNIRLPQSMSR